MKLLLTIVALSILATVAASAAAAKDQRLNFKDVIDTSKKLHCQICHNIVEGRGQWEKAVAEGRGHQLLQCDMPLRQKEPSGGKQIDTMHMRAVLMACLEFVRKGYDKDVLTALKAGKEVGAAQACNTHCSST